MQDKYLKLYCYQVNEQGGSTFSGEGAIYHLPISDIEENEIRSNLAENPYIQFTTAEDSIHSQLYYVIYIYTASVVYLVLSLNQKGLSLHINSVIEIIHG